MSGLCLTADSFQIYVIAFGCSSSYWVFLTGGPKLTILVRLILGAAG